MVRLSSRVIAALFLTACASSVTPTGRSHGAGGTGSQGGLETVELSQLQADVPACGPGYAHPNICCHGAAYEPTICAQDPAHPFRACNAGAFAFPDASACCSLKNPSDCAPPPTADTAPSASCHSPCAPGAYPSRIVDLTFEDSFLCCYGTGMSCDPIQPFCSLCAGPPPRYCDAPCPEGWAVPAKGQVDLCCRDEQDGTRSCFSQAVGIARLSGGAGNSDSKGCRGEHFASDGNSYVMECDFTSPGPCRCLTNGDITRTVSSTSCDTTVCGFPI